MTDYLEFYIKQQFKEYQNIVENKKKFEEIKKGYSNIENDKKNED